MEIWKDEETNLLIKNINIKFKDLLIIFPNKTNAQITSKKSRELKKIRLSDSDNRLPKIKKLNMITGKTYMLKKIKGKFNNGSENSTQSKEVKVIKIYNYLNKYGYDLGYVLFRLKNGRNECIKICDIKRDIKYKEIF